MNRLATLHAAAQKRPEDPRAWFELGMGLLDEAQSSSLGLTLGRPADRAAAAAALLHSLRLGPGDSATAVDLGRAFFALDLHEECVRALSLAIADDPSADAYLLRARAAAEVKDFARSLEDASQALRLGEDGALVHYLYADALRGLGRLDEAQGHLQLPGVASLDDAGIHKLVAEIAGQRGDVEACLAGWNRLRSLAPHDTRVATGRAAALLACARLDEAIEAFREIVATVPRSVEARINLASAARRVGRAQEAESIVLRALDDIDDPAPDLLYELGCIRCELGQHERALHALEAATSLRPDWPEAHFQLGLARDGAGDRQRAVRSLMRAAAEDPDNQTYQDALGRLVAKSEVASSTSAFQGSLASFGVMECLEFLRQQGAVGRLVVTHGSDTAWFQVAGKVVQWADVSRAPSLEREIERALGKTLQELAPDVSVVKGRESAALDQLVDRAAITPQMASRVRKARILACLDVVLDWADGSFSFQKSIPSDHATPRGIDTGMVLLDALRIRDERNR